MKKGTICLDIDGTIANAQLVVPQNTVKFLEEVRSAGWEIVFITGRSLAFARQAVTSFAFPYKLGLQNGADLLQMPEQALVYQAYLPYAALERVVTFCHDLDSDPLVYSGYAFGDFCYYRPNRFSPKLRPYLDKLQTLAAAPWKEVVDFAEAKRSTFPIIKCFGSKQEMEWLNTQLQAVEGIHRTVIADPIDPQFTLLLVTHWAATKGCIVNQLLKNKMITPPIIGAGDDLNDRSMLEVVDYAIVMKNAPKSLHALADAIAPSVEEEGIITALKEAIKVSTI